MIYNEIHQLRSAGFTNSAIARKLKISRNRVIDYGKMSSVIISGYVIAFTSAFLAFLLSVNKPKKKKYMIWGIALMIPISPALCNRQVEFNTFPQLRFNTWIFK
ncbi:hypothetical protein KQ939_17720 [Planococcus sp. CP5-4]|uniref:hypothetical protein n=1 Tax=Planococcus sp. CP5-4 TaxID=2849036 RepID=UPI001CA509A1|nr:hypothetical protein [Planococcus sp. CP5-4]MBW6065492.1 hypothetical protein [Planococcus sp. CP5-4]